MQLICCKDKKNLHYVQIFLYFFNETVKRQVILRMNKELSEDETDKKDLADKTQ